MKFEYTGRHIEVTPALRKHVEEQFARVNHLFETKPSKAHVIIGVERGRHRSEIVLKWRRELLTATTTNSDMYLSLSQTISKLEKQALRIKNKVIDKSHKAKRPSPEQNERSEKNKDGSKPRIIIANRYPVKPMTTEEATLLIESGKDNFVVFRNAENEKISVLYKRQDGNFGLIQP